MCNMCEEVCFSQKYLLKWAKFRFSTMNLNQKDSLWNWNSLSGRAKIPTTTVCEKKKGLAIAVSKEDHAKHLSPFISLKKVQQ